MSGTAATERRDAAEVARKICARHGDQPDRLIEILHELQFELGFLPRAALTEIASRLNLSRADIHGVVSFYHDFRTTPRDARHTLKICRGEACQSAGCERLVDALARGHDLSIGGTSSDGALALEEVYCLGNCALSPAALYDGALVGRLDPERLDDLVRGARSDRPTGVAVGGDLRGQAAASGGRDAAPDSRREAPVRVFVALDSAARSVGAEAVAEALLREAERRGIAIELVRTGSRGLFWIEPLVEVDAGGARHAFGPVAPDDVPALFDAGFHTDPAGCGHRLALGATEAIPFLKAQTRITFRRCGLAAPLDLAAYEANGGLAALRRAIEIGAAAVVEEVSTSGLRGRGGAGFPAGIKWKTVAGQTAEQKFIACNADEGDSGTYADRMLMEGDPFLLIEGMTIAGLAVGATQGYLYIRSEYPDAIATMRAACDVWRGAGYLGMNVAGTGNAFDIEIRVGAGAYICGEESSMLESLEGKRGEVRAKPPIPAIKGLFGKPTLVHNVLTLAAVPDIVATGGAAYAQHGEGRSLGTQCFQLAGNIACGGLFETGFGITLEELVETHGGGTRSGRPIRAIQIGGPLGAYLPASEIDVAMTYEALAAREAMLGHGGVVVFDDTVDMAAQARFAFHFCAIESCGKCTPCRVGAVRGRETVEKIIAGERVAENVVLVQDLCETMRDGSLCAMGGLTPMPVMSALRHFPEDFERGAGGGLPAAAA